MAGKKKEWKHRRTRGNLKNIHYFMMLLRHLVGVFFASTLCWKNLSYLRIEFLIESVGGQKALSWALDFSGCLLSHVIIEMDCDKHA